MTDETANYAWEKPEVGASADQWGEIWNDTADAMDMPRAGWWMRL